jgi:hypothetical protein
VPEASIARVARQNGINANQISSGDTNAATVPGWAKPSRPELLPVTIASEPKGSNTSLCSTTSKREICGKPADVQLEIRKARTRPLMDNQPHL